MKANIPTLKKTNILIQISLTPKPWDFLSLFHSLQDCIILSRNGMEANAVLPEGKRIKLSRDLSSVYFPPVAASVTTGTFPLFLLLSNLNTQGLHISFQLRMTVHINEIPWNVKSHWDGILVVPSFLPFFFFQKQSQNPELLYTPEMAKWSLDRIRQQIREILI